LPPIDILIGRDRSSLLQGCRVAHYSLYSSIFLSSFHFDMMGRKVSPSPNQNNNDYYEDKEKKTLKEQCFIHSKHFFWVRFILPDKKLVTLVRIWFNCHLENDKWYWCKPNLVKRSRKWSHILDEEIPNPTGNIHNELNNGTQKYSQKFLPFLGCTIS